jgi:hypothetical protein
MAMDSGQSIAELPRVGSAGGPFGGRNRLRCIGEYPAATYRKDICSLRD